MNKKIEALVGAMKTAPEESVRDWFLVSKILPEIKKEHKRDPFKTMDLCDHAGISVGRFMQFMFDTQNGQTSTV